LLKTLVMRTEMTCGGFAIVALWLAFGFVFSASAQVEPMKSSRKSQSFDVLNSVKHDPEMPFNYIMRIVDDYCDKADERRAQITASTWQKERERIKAKLKEMVGNFPVRNALNAKVVGKIERDGYVIEKIIFESQPRFYVTANLYLPSGIARNPRAFPPVPGILAPCGHAPNGKAFGTYQHYYISLALKGYAVLAYDPISQGERLQLLDKKTGKSVAGPGTGEHGYLGNLCYLIGENLALYRIWDGIRAIDYMCSRPEIDRRRIGCTGNSGGGTLTTYIAAFDERVKVAVPGCYITTLRERIRSRVTADPEQNFVPIIAEGIDHSDMLALVAPGAVLICAATKDFFPIKGTRIAFERLKRIYGMMGLSAKVELVEVNKGHGFHKELREAMYGWMNKWFGVKESAAEPPLKIEKDETLYCTKTGQVLSSLGGETVLTILRRKLKKVFPKITVPSDATGCKRYQNTMRKRIEKVLNMPTAQGEVREVFSKRGKYDSLIMERIALETEQGILVPCILLKPSDAKGRLPAVLSIHEDGKAADIKTAGKIAKEGFVVFTIDPRGMSETKSKLNRRGDYYRLYGIETDLTYSSFMIGRPLFGMRVFDVIRCAEYLAEREDVDSDRLLCRGVGSGGLLALYAAALDKKIVGVLAENFLSTYHRLFDGNIYKHHVNIFLPSALKYYDLPDVVACIAPRPAALLKPLDHMKQPITDSAARKDYSRAIAAYRALDAPDNLLLNSGNITLILHRAENGQ